MKIANVDCSKPLDHPERMVIRDVTAKEKKEIEDHWALEDERAKQPKPKTHLERIEELEAKIAALSKAK